MDENPALSTWIRTRRREVRLTQQGLATALGIAVRTVQRWEAGDGSDMRLAHYQQLLELLGDEGAPPLDGAAAPIEAQIADLRRHAQEVERRASTIAGRLADVERGLERLTARVEAQGEALRQELLADAQDLRLRATTKGRPPARRTGN